MRISTIQNRISNVRPLAFNSIYVENNVRLNDNAFNTSQNPFLNKNVTQTLDYKISVTNLNQKELDEIHVISLSKLQSFIEFLLIIIKIKVYGDTIIILIFSKGPNNNFN